MSFSIQGLPVNVKYSPDAVVSRISAEVWRSSLLVTSISVGTSSAAFTCVVKFIIDPYMEDCDVVLGSEWKDICDAQCIIPLSLAPLPVYEVPKSELSSTYLDNVLLPSVPPPVAIRNDHNSGNDLPEHSSRTRSSSPSSSAADPRPRHLV
ncbi:hypothetical protein CPB84DRAFT_1765302 [Gymnopilus junonius]|uniref:Uncharacterized protein n=1 Tax=Gymnopilus junonius TaxID=109634 RepID=A0A9P5NYJ5_GYMJU|nr:hypothetical protein CPB84DRAFT_1765302 [Gymnopilus junonius]